MKIFVIIAIISHDTIVSWYWDILIYTVIWGLVFEALYKYLLVKKVAK
ncbi:MAG: hypothetical protein JSW41_04080 [Candidatus Aenigmatarchaeota archaeon]|nr:MAG: hypothetical protein JSW41_04080 [Candidatus Aenigmarchaeota archaeon]